MGLNRNATVVATSLAIMIPEIHYLGTRDPTITGRMRCMTFLGRAASPQDGQDKVILHLLAYYP